MQVVEPEESDDGCQKQKGQQRRRSEVTTEHRPRWAPVPWSMRTKPSLGDLKTGWRESSDSGKGAHSSEFYWKRAENWGCERETAAEHRETACLPRWLEVSSSKGTDAEDAVGGLRSAVLEWGRVNMSLRIKQERWIQIELIRHF